MRDMFLRNEGHVDVSNESSTNTSNTKKELTQVEAARLAWKDAWYSQFHWIEFNSDLGRVFCKVCRDKQARNVFARAGSVNIKVSAFQDHNMSIEHKKLEWAANQGEKAMKKIVEKSITTCDDALITLFRSAYFLAKEIVPLTKFPSLCKLLLNSKSNITESLYHDEKSCAEMVFCISNVIQKKNLDRIRDSKFFGLMIDESTDVSVTGHVVVFATFVEDGLPVSIFLGLLEIANGRKDAEEIFQKLLKYVKEWGLDLSKCVAFGSDGCSTMVGSKSGVATRLKEVSPFVVSVHCIAHRTNLATLQAAESNECKVVSSEIDKTINLLAAHFKKSGKKKTILHAIQKELNDAYKTLKRFHKIRWLFRSEAISTLCDFLESVLVFFRDVPKEKGDGTIPLCMRN